MQKSFIYFLNNVCRNQDAQEHIHTRGTYIYCISDSRNPTPSKIDIGSGTKMMIHE